MSDIWNIESLYKLSSKNCFCLQLLLEELQTRYFNRAVLAEAVYEFEEKNVQPEKNVQEKNVQPEKSFETMPMFTTKELVGCGKNVHLLTTCSPQLNHHPKLDIVLKFTVLHFIRTIANNHYVNNDPFGIEQIANNSQLRYYKLIIPNNNSNIVRMWSTSEQYCKLGCFL